MTRPADTLDLSAAEIFSFLKEISPFNQLNSAELKNLAGRAKEALCFRCLAKACVSTPIWV